MILQIGSCSSFSITSGTYLAAGKEGGDDTDIVKGVEAAASDDYGTESDLEEVKKAGEVEVKKDDRKKRGTGQLEYDSEDGRILFKDKNAVKRWDGTVDRTFLDFANEWEEKFEAYDERENQKKQEVMKRGENWTEEHEMDNESFSQGFMINDLANVNDMRYLRDEMSKTFGPGFQDESVFGSGIVDGKTSLRAMVSRSYILSRV